MDQQGVSFEIQEGAAATAAEVREPGGPLGPFGLTLSLLGIAGAAILLCSLVWAAGFAVLIARQGLDGASDFLEDLKFDGPLDARVGAGVICALYGGLIVATLAAAILRGGRRWPALVALSPVRTGAWRAIATIVLVTLAYATIATWLMERDRDGYLLISGPTDLLLIGTIMLNLVILAPIAEELLFRGWLYTALRRRFAFWSSFLVTLVLFAGVHWDPNHQRRIVQVLPLAFGLGLLRERAGSIKPTIALHAVYNLIIVLIRLAYT